MEDNEVGLVSTAVIDYVSLSPLTDNDPISAPKDIVNMIEDGTTLQMRVLLSERFFTSAIHACAS